MKVSSPKNFLRALLVYATAVSLATGLGCSLLSSNGDSPADSTSFHATVPASTGSLTPVPVEIADDIAKISAGGKIDPVKPTPVPPVAAGENPQVVPAANAQVLKPDENRGPAKENFSLAVAHGGKSISYVVKRGDTLMKIAFEKYGNLYRWKEIYQSNRDKLQAFNILPVGSILRIDGVEYVVIERNGKPYLIRRNDTLFKIAKGIYGAPGDWRVLWNNNRQMIHDPNKIYAGFTLYYRPPGGNVPIRPPASVK